jgi:hypothetical protein
MVCVYIGSHIGCEFLHAPLFMGFCLALVCFSAVGVWTSFRRLLEVI